MSHNYHSHGYEVYPLHYQLGSADHICILRELLLTFKAQSNAHLWNNQVYGAGEEKRGNKSSLKHIKEQFS